MKDKTGRSRFLDTEFNALINGETGLLVSQIGNTQKIYKLYLQSPAEALAAMNPSG